VTKCLGSKVSGNCANSLLRQTTTVNLTTRLNNKKARMTAHSGSWSVNNGRHFNEKKTKELLIYFGTKTYINSVPSITFNCKTIEKVDNFKLLGVVISLDLGIHM